MSQSEIEKHNLVYFIGRPISEIASTDEMRAIWLHFLVYNS